MCKELHIKPGKQNFGNQTLTVTKLKGKSN